MHKVERKPAPTPKGVPAAPVENRDTCSANRNVDCLVPSHLPAPEAALVQSLARRQGGAMPKAAVRPIPGEVWRARPTNQAPQATGGQALADMMMRDCALPAGDGAEFRTVLARILDGQGCDEDFVFAVEMLWPRHRNRAPAADCVNALPLSMRHAFNACRGLFPKLCYPTMAPWSSADKLLLFAVLANREPLVQARIVTLLSLSMPCSFAAAMDDVGVMTRSTAASGGGLLKQRRSLSREDRGKLGTLVGAARWNFLDQVSTPSSKAVPNWGRRRPSR